MVLNLHLLVELSLKLLVGVQEGTAILGTRLISSRATLLRNRTGGIKFLRRVLHGGTNAVIQTDSGGRSLVRLSWPVVHALNGMILGLSDLLGTVDRILYFVSGVLLSVHCLNWFILFNMAFPSIISCRWTILGNSLFLISVGTLVRGLDSAIQSQDGLFVLGVHVHHCLNLIMLSLIPIRSYVFRRLQIHLNIGVINISNVAGGDV